MAHPSEVHTNGPLSTYISAYTNGAYAADIVCPVIKVNRKSNTFVTYSRKDATTPVSDLAGPTSAVNESDYTQSTDSYSVEDRALVGYVSFDEVANADEPQKPFEKRSNHIMNQLMLAREIRVATLLQTTSNYASSNFTAASVVWSNESTGTPLTDLLAMRAAIPPAIEDGTKLVLILALEAWNALRKHPQMRGDGAIKPVLVPEEAAALIGVDEIIISEAQKNTANPGQTASYSRIWDRTKAVMVRVPTGELKGEASVFAGTFRFTNGMDPVQVRTWEAPDRGVRGSTAVQVSFSDDEKVVQNDMGFCLTAVLA